MQVTEARRLDSRDEKRGERARARLEEEVGSDKAARLHMICCVCFDSTLSGVKNCSHHMYTCRHMHVRIAADYCTGPCRPSCTSTTANDCFFGTISNRPLNEPNKSLVKSGLFLPCETGRSPRWKFGFITALLTLHNHVEETVCQRNIAWAPLITDAIKLAKA